MACLWLAHLAFATFNIFLGVLFALASTDFCGSVFETEVDHALLGHNMSTNAVVDEFECQLKCLGNNSCKSFNVRPSGNNANYICELNNKTRQMKPGDFKWKKGSTYYGSVQVSCIENREAHSGHCHPGYKGTRCQSPKLGWYSHHPAHSCKNIRDAGDSKGDGEYWIDPENNGNPLKVYCDMTTDGGGWLLVSNVVLDSSSLSLELSRQTSYRGISSYHSNKMVLKKDAIKQLRTHLSFTQLRFYCSKQHGRTFHVTTAANSTGEAVVQYFSGQTDAMPYSCNSFVRMKNDNSMSAKVCEKWGRENGIHTDVGKWGAERNYDRLYNHIFSVWRAHQWHIWPEGARSRRLECDDFIGGAVSSGDFWKVYVR